LRRLAWKNTGPKQFERAEMSIFETLKSHFNSRYISVLNYIEQIWAISLNLTSKNIPLVLIHGFPEGVCLCSLNLDQLCSDRPIDPVDLPGFALNKEFILLGHSFAGFLSASYTLHYPAYVKQLVLIDPWRFSEKSEDIWQTGRLQKVPIWARSFSSIMMKLSPVTGLRVTGPFGN
jgi:pimeloyl-ACP methyl ester carboxylesterase